MAARVRLKPSVRGLRRLRCRNVKLPDARDFSVRFDFAKNFANVSAAQTLRSLIAPACVRALEGKQGLWGFKSQRALLRPFANQHHANGQARYGPYARFPF